MTQVTNHFVEINDMVGFFIILVVFFSTGFPYNIEHMFLFEVLQMEKIRPTSHIREILLRTITNNWIEEESKKVNETIQLGVFHPIQKRLQSEIAQFKRELHENAIFIMNMEWSQMDVKVTYKDNGKIYKDISFMMPMLTAEALGKIDEGWLAGT